MSHGRLLIVEDDVDLAEMLQVYFASQGYEAHVVHTGDEGIMRARELIPHLVLLDVMLPGMDGFDVCQDLRTTNRTRFIPIIFLTQRDSRRDKISGLELGADDYITKPFDIDELRLRVQGSIRRATREALYDPRTGLPTAILVNEQLKFTTGSQDEWQFLVVQIDGFLPFRDVYGFMAADEALTLVVRLMTELLNDLGDTDDFLGHLGDQRFIILTQSKHHQLLQDRLQEQFNAAIGAFYNFTERERGFIEMEDSDGNTRQEPLMNLSVHPSLPSQLTD